ncbi:hypothetical protein OAI93_00825 [bacterium]|nr:hypothetical protein [bacterium]
MKNIKYILFIIVMFISCDEGAGSFDSLITPPYCSDVDACNFETEEQCVYAEESYNCDGECIIDIDCFGVCGGNALINECGVCDGDILEENYDCDGNCIVDTDCFGICAGNAYLDICGNCCDSGLTVDCEIDYTNCNGYGCMDSVACNYNSIATISCDECCVYPEENYDCDGNCIVGLDCSGICGGDSIYDECGICGGDGPSYQCWDGILYCSYDDCGAGWWCEDENACNYGEFLDCIYPEENYDCYGNCIVGVDCSGICGGDSIYDECGICGGTGANYTCWDGSLECDLVNCPDEEEGNLSIYYDNSSSAPIAGFQFTVTGVDVLGASGGAAEEAGFTVSTSNLGIVIGFSFSGEVISPGQGLLLNLEINGDTSEACLTDLIFSDSNGEALNATLEDCVNIIISEDELTGCMDSAACNYNSNATIDDGSCDYGDACWDGSLECDLSDCPDQVNELTIYYTNNSFHPIAGFQFTVIGVDVLGASGGDSEEAGFTVSTSELGIVIGFSFTGSVMNQGGGILLNLEIGGDPSQACLTDLIFSDSQGNPLYAYLDDCNHIIIELELEQELEGCTDSNACNYNSDAIVNDGSCDYGDVCWNGSLECNLSDCPDEPITFYEDFTDISDWQNVNEWFVSTSYRCQDNPDGSDGTCAKFYLPNYNNNSAAIMERNVSVSIGQTLTYYGYSDWGSCSLYLNNVYSGECSGYYSIPISFTGNLNIKFIGSTGALTRAWVDELRIE